MEALGHLSPRTMTRVRPLLDMPKLNSKAKKSLESYFVETIQTIAATWGTRMPLYLDLSLYEPDTRANGQAAIEFLFLCARQLRLQAIPVAGPEILRGPGLTYLQGVGRIARIDGRGAAVRFHYADIVSPTLFARSLSETLGVLELGPEVVDLYFDLDAMERLPVGIDTDTLIKQVTSAIRAVAAERFRTIVICASSVPEVVGKQYNKIGLKVARPEMRLWQTVAKSSSTILPCFGDYGIVYPHETDPAKVVKVPARIRFSTPDQFHLYRAERDNYRLLASLVKEDSGFYATSPSWGLSSVVASADGYGNVGGPRDWVARDTNHHIEGTTATVEKYLKTQGRLAELAFAAPSREPWLQELLTSAEFP